MDCFRSGVAEAGAVAVTKVAVTIGSQVRYLRDKLHLHYGTNYPTIKSTATSMSTAAYYCPPTASSLPTMG